MIDPPHITGDRSGWLHQLTRPSVIIALVAVVASGGAWTGAQLVAIAKMSDRQERTDMRMDKLEGGFVSFQKDIAERVTSIDRQATVTALSVAAVAPELRAIHDMLTTMDSRTREEDARTLDYIRRVDERETRHNDQVAQTLKPVGGR